MDTAKRSLDPPAAIMGIGATVLAWAAGIPAVAGATIGLVTYGIASTGTLMRRRRAGTAPVVPEAGEAPVVQLHANEERWVRRGADAVTSIGECVQWLTDGPLRDRLTEVAEQAREVLDDVRTLAAQASTTRAAGRQLDASRLTADLTRLTTKLGKSEGSNLEEDLQRSLEAVREQLGIHRRLEDTRNLLQARIESGSIGLQRLAAQVSEMTTMATPDASAQQGPRIEELSVQLEALRSGLSDAGALSRRALGGTDTGGGRS